MACDDPRHATPMGAESARPASLETFSAPEEGSIGKPILVCAFATCTDNSALSI